MKNGAICEKGEAMAFVTEFTKLFGIELPVMEGGMQNVAHPVLAAAVSNAGGLGTTNISMYPDLGQFRNALKEIKALTDKPFAVNVSMIPNVDMGEKIRQYLDICAQEGVSTIETAGKNPKEFVDIIHDGGMKIIHKVPMVKHAVSAVKSGVDAVSIVGSEAAGHPSPDLVGTMVLAQKAALAQLGVPFLIGGGICTGSALAAALTLGADGVVMGTRFLASCECPISNRHKDWILNASETDTVLCQRAIRNMVRVAHNAAADECLELEKHPGVTLEDLLPVISGAAGKKAYETGDISRGMFAVGQGIGLIRETMAVQEIMDELLQEADASIRRAAGCIFKEIP